MGNSVRFLVGLLIVNLSLSPFQYAWCDGDEASDVGATSTTASTVRPSFRGPLGMFSAMYHMPAPPLASAPASAPASTSVGTPDASLPPVGFSTLYSGSSPGLSIFQQHGILTAPAFMVLSQRQAAPKPDVPPPSEVSQETSDSNTTSVGICKDPASTVSTFVTAVDTIDLMRKFYGDARLLGKASQDGSTVLVDAAKKEAAEVFAPLKGITGQMRGALAGVETEALASATRTATTAALETGAKTAIQSGLKTAARGNPVLASAVLLGAVVGRGVKSGAVSTTLLAEKVYNVRKRLNAFASDSAVQHFEDEMNPAGPGLIGTREVPVDESKAKTETVHLDDAAHTAKSTKAASSVTKVGGPTSAAMTAVKSFGSAVMSGAKAVFHSVRGDRATATTHATATVDHADKAFNGVKDLTTLGKGAHRAFGRADDHFGSDDSSSRDTSPPPVTRQPSYRRERSYEPPSYSGGFDDWSVPALERAPSLRREPSAAKESPPAVERAPSVPSHSYEDLLNATP